jgi:hypothetical protein
MPRPKRQIINKIRESPRNQPMLKPALSKPTRAMAFEPQGNYLLRQNYHRIQPKRLSLLKHNFLNAVVDSDNEASTDFDFVPDNSCMFCFN